MIDYHFSPNLNLAAKNATAALNSALQQALLAKQPVLLLLAGGSALLLLEGIKLDNLSQNITLSVLDERYSSDPKINNLAQIMASSFYPKARQAGAEFIDTRVQDQESPQVLAKRFETGLKDWLTKFPQGIIIATIGIGPDGHLAGIMPYPEDPEQFEKKFNQPANLVVSYNAGTKNPYPDRVTVTMPFLRKINTAIVYAIGENKQAALKKVLAEQGELALTPARILREMTDQVDLFTDLKNLA